MFAFSFFRLSMYKIDFYEECERALSCANAEKIAIISCFTYAEVIKRAREFAMEEVVNRE